MLKVTVILTLAVLGMASSAQGVLLFYDGFTGPTGVGNLAGQVSNVGGAAWTGSDAFWDVVGDGFTYPDLSSSGGRAESNRGGNAGDWIRNAPAAVATQMNSAGPMYFTMLFRDDGKGADTTWGGHGAFHIRAPGLVVSPIEDNNNPAGTLRILETHGVGGGEARHQVGDGVTGLHDGDVHLLAMRIVNDGSTGVDDIDAVIDPVLSAGEPNWDTVSTPPFTINTLDITGTGYDLTMSNELIDPISRFNSFDEIRIATTWGEATGGGMMALPLDFTWRDDKSGDWTEQNNWDPIGVPGVENTMYTNHTVTFGPIIGSRSTVFTDSDVTVRAITFNSSESYNVSGHGNVYIVQGTASGSPALSSIAVAEGSHQFQAPVSLQNDTTLDVGSDAALTFNNALNLNNNTLTKIGEGTMAINNVLGTSGGTVNCNAGTCAGIGTISGDLNNGGGTISPGNSPGSLSVVPEPAAWLLLMLGIVGCLGLRRR